MNEKIMIYKEGEGKSEGMVWDTFTDEQGRCVIAGLPVPKQVFDRHMDVIRMLEELREEVRHAFQHDHVIELREDYWGLQHPLTCRPDLIGCIYNRFMEEYSNDVLAIVGDYGRYFVSGLSEESFPTVEKIDPVPEWYQDPVMELRGTAGEWEERDEG